MEDDTVIGALTLPGNAALTAAYLQSRFFFMDNVSVSDASTEFAQIELLGPEAGITMTALGFSTLPEKNQISTSDLDGIAVQAILTDGFAVRLLIPVEGINSVFATLKRTGALPLKKEAYAVLRVEAGLPAAGHKLTGDYTPLEVGLKGAVSITKGCYTGQEVIARQVNFDKVTKQMVGLRLEEDLNSGKRVWSLENRQPAGMSHLSLPLHGWAPSRLRC